MTDDQAFAQFYAATSRRVLGQAFALVGNVHEAQDLVQDAYMKAWLDWPRIAHYDDPLAWVQLVTWRLAASRWRRLRSHAKWLRGGDDRSREPGTGEPSVDGVLVVQALRKLPLKQREVLVMHYLADMSVEAIASRFGRPVGTVKAQLARGRVSLSMLLGDPEAEQLEGREREYDG